MSTRPSGEDSKQTTIELSAFPHPETGELLDSREDFLAAINEIEERLVPFYKLRRVQRLIAHERAERYPSNAEQPEPRYRTVTQEKVARCPRCGGRLESEEAPS